MINERPEFFDDCLRVIYWQSRKKNKGLDRTAELFSVGKKSVARWNRYYEEPETEFKLRINDDFINGLKALGYRIVVSTNHPIIQTGNVEQDISDAMKYILDTDFNGNITRCCDASGIGYTTITRTINKDFKNLMVSYDLYYWLEIRGFKLTLQEI